MASETCALDLIGAQYLRDIEPGEVLLINSGGLHSFFLAKEQTRGKIRISVKAALASNEIIK